LILNRTWRPATVPRKPAQTIAPINGSHWPKANPRNPNATVFSRCYTVISKAWVATKVLRLPPRVFT
jgi:hypothetical protein